jgi:catechol 2,3-dioxygenase-like lactoylglutathione lyase family enzyme
VKPATASVPTRNEYHRNFRRKERRAIASILPGQFGQNPYAVLTIRGIDHVVLRVRDIERMRKFYCEVLGATHVAYRPEFGMSHLRVGTSMIDLVEVDGPLGKPGGAAPGREGRNMDHLCLRVEPFDQDAIVAHLKMYGVMVGDIKNRFGAEGNGASIYLTDPEGNIVELKGPSDGKAAP